ncbi:MAG: MATE family multidrug resistance protein [Verrucomicrobiales bacterium]|jgi:MATE family multidrug resistance protein
MHTFPILLREARSTAVLAVPLIAGQLSHMLMAVADTVMIGRLGVVPLAAATFANNIIHLPFMVVIGMTIAVSVRVSQARGCMEPETARAALRHGMLLGLIAGILTMIGAFALTPFLGYFGQESSVAGEAGVYFQIIGISIIPAACSMAIKNHADAMNRPWPAFSILLTGVGLNVLLNWILIYGNLGLPAMGLEGAGVATLIARVLTIAGLVYWCTHDRAIREWVPNHWFKAPEWTAVKSLFKIGMPASMQLLAESSAFVAATILIGTISKEALAAHQVAISCAATIFMVPLGLSMALTVRIGEAWGANAFDRLRPIVISSGIMAIGFTLVSAQCFVFFNEIIAGWFLTDPTALKLSATLLLVAAAFQFSDALQIVFAGALRGVNDVRVPAWLAFFAYWVISLPLGWWLSYGLDWGVIGMWWGITAGLTLTAVTLGIRTWIKTANASHSTSTVAEISHG